MITEKMVKSLEVCFCFSTKTVFQNCNKCLIAQSNFFFPVVKFSLISSAAKKISGSELFMSKLHCGTVHKLCVLAKA